MINQISQNYTAVAQMANLLAEWLILAGVVVTDVQAMVENHLKDMILRTFDPKKADTIFTEEGEVSRSRSVGGSICQSQRLVCGRGVCARRGRRI